MAINPNTNTTIAGRITAPSSGYPYGSAKNETTPGAGDGTPYFKARADDIFGFQQALLAAAAITPSGNADQVGASQYLDALHAIINAAIAALGTLSSGTYTPSGLTATNATLGAIDMATWTRQGNIVTVAGRLTISAAVNNATVDIHIPLPVASAMTGDADLSGSASVANGLSQNFSANIFADFAADKAQINFYNQGGVGGKTIAYTYQYLVR